MARKVGRVNEMKVDFAAYSYIINGVAGIGKTTLAHEIGKKITGSNEGTLILSVGEEPVPAHIDGAFYEKVGTWKEFVDTIDELCKNKNEYPDTKFVAFDSLDEMFRIAEDFVVKEYNKAQTDLSKHVKVIGAAYGGFQRGENRVVEVVISTIFKLEKAGYKILPIGHTKVKSKVDPITEISYEQLTCNLDNKYYNAIKDKVNLVAMCYVERTMEATKEVKNEFTKKMQKKGKLSGEKRVIVFRDEDDMTVDTKSHFRNIQSKVEFGVDHFIGAVEAAIKLDLEEKRGVKVSDDELLQMSKAQEIEKSVAVEENIKAMAESAIDVNRNTELVSAIMKKAGEATPDVIEQMVAVLAANGRTDFSHPETFKTVVLEQILALL